MVAIEPLSRYRNGVPVSRPLIRAVIWRAACLAPWIATGDTPGRLSSAIMSPITKTSG